MKTKTCLLHLLSIISLSCCEGPKGDPGPIGLPSPPPTQAKQGFIKGILTTQMDGKPKDFKFDFQGKNYGDENYYEVINDSVTNISVGKIYARDGEPYVNGKCLLAFTVKNLKSLTLKPISVNPTSVQLNFRKDMNNSQLLDAIVYSIPLTKDSLSFTEVQYDSISKVIKGKFYSKIFQRNAEGKDIYANTISDGSFSSEIYRQLRNNKRVE